MGAETGGPLLGFTTLGCPGWDLATALRRGAELGFDGIDFRGIGPHHFDPSQRRYTGLELDITLHPLFTAQLDQTLGLLKHSGLKVAGLSSGASFASSPPNEARRAIDEVRRYIRLAQKLGCKTVRVFGGSFDRSKMTLDDAKRNLVSALRELAPMAADAGVRLAVETHDAWMESRNLRDVLEEVDSPSVGALWDVHHPFRFCSESPEETWRQIGRWVIYTHVKDSVADPSRPEGFRYCHTGEGTIPLAEILTTLARGGYEGYLTFEWELLWHPELAPPEEAFPRYIQVMRQLISEAWKRTR